MKFLTTLLALVVLTVAPVAHAASSAVPVRTVYNCCAVTSSAWTPVVLSTARAIKGVSISNSGTVGILLGLGASGAEVSQLTIPASSSAPVYYPIVFSQSQKVSIKALGSTGSTGEANLNFFYN